jgi:hypothetical protein
MGAITPVSSGMTRCCSALTSKAEKKEALLVDFVQVGIHLGGMIGAGHPGWEGFGGHRSSAENPNGVPHTSPGSRRFPPVPRRHPG